MLDYQHINFLSAEVGLTSINVEKPHWHQEHIRTYIELVIPRLDSYRCRINQKELVINPGQAVIVQPYDRHEDFYRPGSELLFIQFIVSGMLGTPESSRIFNSHGQTNKHVVELSPNSSVNTILELIRSHNQNNAFRQIIMEKLCEVFFWELIDLIPEVDLDAEFVAAIGQNAMIKRVNEYFRKRLTAKLNIEQLAKELGMSRRTLEIKFVRWFGDSPSNTFIRLKMQAAAGMIKSGLSIKETAEKLGYTDQFYFSTVFSRVMEVAPSKWASQEQ